MAKFGPVLPVLAKRARAFPVSLAVRNGSLPTVRFADHSKTGNHSGSSRVGVVERAQSPAAADVAATSTRSETHSSGAGQVGSPGGDAWRLVGGLVFV